MALRETTRLPSTVFGPEAGILGGLVLPGSCADAEGLQFLETALDAEEAGILNSGEAGDFELPVAFFAVPLESEAQLAGIALEGGGRVTHVVFLDELLDAVAVAGAVHLNLDEAGFDPGIAKGAPEVTREELDECVFGGVGRTVVATECG
jgi:hypothetical protein